VFLLDHAHVSNKLAFALPNCLFERCGLNAIFRGGFFFQGVRVKCVWWWEAGSVLMMSIAKEISVRKNMKQ